MDQNISAAPDDVQETDKNDMNLNAPDSALLITGSAAKLTSSSIANYQSMYWKHSLPWFCFDQNSILNLKLSG